MPAAYTGINSRFLASARSTARSEIVASKVASRPSFATRQRKQINVRELPMAVDVVPSKAAVFPYTRPHSSPHGPDVTQLDGPPPYRPRVARQRDSCSAPSYLDRWTTLGSVAPPGTGSADDRTRNAVHRKEHTWRG